MSFYADIYNDFPLRCGRLCAEKREPPLAKEFDVTFMLMAASAGFATAWEQLKIQPGQADCHSGRHPAFLGYKPDLYSRSLKIVNEELSKTLDLSSLFEKANFAHWFKGQVCWRRSKKACFALPERVGLSQQSWQTLRHLLDGV
ncbi:MAG: hypothetical protein WCG12_13955 [Alcaligenaceae bacterium]